MRIRPVFPWAWQISHRENKFVRHILLECIELIFEAA
jgi:hypothetical protein